MRNNKIRKKDNKNSHSKNKNDNNFDNINTNNTYQTNLQKSIPEDYQENLQRNITEDADKESDITKKDNVNKTTDISKTTNINKRSGETQINGLSKVNKITNLAPIKTFIDYVSGFNPVVWLLVLATFIESFGRFLVVPYLSIYLSRKGVSLTSIGAVLGIGPLAAFFFSMIGGHLSDSIGRKPVQIIGVILSGLSFLGFAISNTNLYLLAFFNFLTTMTRTFYRPAVNAAIADITPIERRSEAMGFTRVSLNLAYGLAPFLGVLFATYDKPIGFIIASILSLSVGLLVAIAIPETHKKVQKQKTEKRSFKAAKQNLGESFKSYKVMFFDRSFLLWNIANIVLFGVYGYIQSFLPIHLNNQKMPLWIYATMLSINAFICTIFQIPMSIKFAKAKIGLTAMYAMIGYVIGFTMFGFSKSSLLLFIGMVILSTGEIIHAAVSVRFVPEIAPEGLLGRYLGFSGIQELGPFFFNIIGGFVFQKLGGSALFLIAAFGSILGGVLKYLADKRMMPLKRN